jgi:fatty-acyl-CoA synthase
MLGLMQDWPLLCHRIIDHAAIQHGNREVVTRSIEGPIHRTNYREIRKRALKVAQRLEKEGVKLGDRVATLAWNTWRHLETWYGITGIGAIYHTINPRLFPDQIAYIANHAEDRLMFLDTTFVPLMEKLQDKLPSIQRYVILTDAAHMPQTALRNAVAYEDWIAEVDGDFTWASFDENTACGMCYTSGTTGNPTRTVPTCCIRWSRSRPTRSTSRCRTPSCRWCRSSTPMAGPLRSRRRCRAAAWFCPA